MTIAIAPPDPAAAFALGSATDLGVVAVFAVVYLGMFLGGLPRLKIDRTGVALLGAIAMIVITGMSLEEAARGADLPTLVLLFAFMVLSAQMRLGGFYAAVTRAVGDLPWSRTGLVGALIAVVALLSAVFTNDVVCLAVTPLALRIALRRGLDPVPVLVGLACAANMGSAATLIGNPQNMLIGSVMRLNFAAYVTWAIVPVALSLVLLWIWLVRGALGRSSGPPVSLPADGELPIDRLQCIKGLGVAASLMAAFLFTDLPREVLALVGAAVLLLSRRMHSARLMGFVDGPLLVLFIGLFVVNHGFARTGLAAQAVAAMAAQGVVLSDPGALLIAGVLLSNLVSNVPAVMLMLPHLHDPAAGALLALVSTFAGNLLLVGSIANLIVADLARRDGIVIDWRRHAAIGVPVTIGSLTLLWGWLRLTA